MQFLKQSDHSGAINDNKPGSSVNPGLEPYLHRCSLILTEVHTHARVWADYIDNKGDRSYSGGENFEDIYLEIIPSYSFFYSFETLEI
ncbi:hypothetical protein SADUNF_Sadunf16G0259400 [Salix dunnii]|uniref:Uncharacterized protein n=1 Tax=Salix dunnii TaxID=1413687 RepID=A0A835JAV5_9ROSI|nr:hypothetical protein SADUNF_Sadunf16G0259400 [Salix dunnii]